MGDDFLVENQVVYENSFLQKPEEYGEVRLAANTAHRPRSASNRVASRSFPLHYERIRQFLPNLGEP